MAVSPADRRSSLSRSARIWRRVRVLVLTSGVAAVLGSLLVVAPAQADGLMASEPGVREGLDQAPGWVTLAFDTEVDPSMAKILVQDTDGRNVTTGSLIVEGTNVTTQLQDGLAPGTYTVSYRINRSDGEPAGGAYQFAYGSGDFGDPPDQTWTGRAEEPAAMNDPDPNAVTPRPTATVAVPEVEVERQDSAAPFPGSEPTAGESDAQGSNTGGSETGDPTAAPSGTSDPAATPTPSAPTEGPGSGLEMPPWPVWLALGAFGLFLMIAAVAFLRSRR